MPTLAHPFKVLAGPVKKWGCLLDTAAICVLDDDPSMLKALDRLLKADGFNVAKFSEPSGLSLQPGTGFVSGGDPRRLDA